MPLTPDSVRESEEEGQDEDDYPLRILEDIISTQFDGLRDELSGLTSLKADLDSFDKETLLDALATRVEGILADARTVEADDRVLAFKDVVEEGQKRTELAFLAAIQDLKAQYQASRMVVTAPTSPASLDLTDDLRDSLVDAVSKAVQGRLDATPSEGSRNSRQVLQKVVADAVKPLADLISSTSASRAEPDSPLLTKLDTNLALLLARVESLSSSSSSYHAKDRAALVEELQASIKSITFHSPPVNLDADDLVFRLALAIQPQITGIVERLADKKKETANFIVEQLKPLVNGEATPASPQVDQEKLVEALVERRRPVVASAGSTTVVTSESAPFDLEALVERIAATRSKEADWSAKFETLHAALQQRSEGPESLQIDIVSLQKDVGSRLKSSNEQLVEQIKMLLGQHAPSARVADLEAQ